MQQGNNRPTGLVLSGGSARLGRPLTAAEIQRGYTGRQTTDGRALITFQGRVLAVPASRVGIPAARLANDNRTARWTPQQRSAMRLDIQKLVGAGGGSGGGDGSGAGGGGRRNGPAAANDNSMSANRVMFAKFWKSIPDPDNAMFGHSRGFDFAKPVNKVVLKAGTEVCQWQLPGYNKGMYFAACGSRPTRLGIADSASRTVGGPAELKIQTRYRLKQDVEVLSGTAAAHVDDHSLKPQRVPTEGGDRQFLVHPDNLQAFQAD